MLKHTIRHPDQALECPAWISISSDANLFSIMTTSKGCASNAAPRPSATTVRLRGISAGLIQAGWLGEAKHMLLMVISKNQTYPLEQLNAVAERTRPTYLKSGMNQVYSASVPTAPWRLMAIKQWRPELSSFSPPLKVTGAC